MKGPYDGDYIIICSASDVRKLKRKLDLWKNKKVTVVDIETDKEIDEWFGTFDYIAKKLICISAIRWMWMETWKKSQN